MRKTIILGLISLQLILSCTKSKDVTISGEIQQYDNTPFIIYDYKTENSPDTIIVSDGKFSTIQQIDNPCIKTISFGQNRKEIFLVPGQSLTISFLASNADSSFKFEGDFAFENSIIDSMLQHFYTLDYNYVYSLNAHSASKYLDSILITDKQYFEKLTNSKTVHHVFTELSMASIEYQYAWQKISLGHNEDIQDSTYYSFISNLTMENANYLDLENYRMFLHNYIATYAEKSLNELDSIQYNLPNAYFDEQKKVIENFKNTKIKEYLIFNNISGKLDYSGVKDFDKYYEYFNTNNTDSIYARQMSKLYQKKLLLAPGKPAPSFTCIDIDSNMVSLADFKGKFVYIDFWATWCGPCKQELPEYIKLQSEFNGKNIVFISISLDDDKNSWKNVVIENKNEGISLFAEKGWDSDVARAYQIGGVPTFVLIDKDGNFIDSQAPRPSSDKIREILADLLEI